MTTALARTTTLAQNEATIAAGLATFREVGEALLAIREGRQYLEAADDNGELFTTFEGYCKSRWGMSRNYANKMILASEVVAALPVGTTVPTTESQARALAPIRDDPELMAEVVHTVATTGPVTAERITEVVEAFTVEAPPNGPDPARPCYQAIGTIKGLVLSIEGIDWTCLPVSEMRGAEIAITELRKSLNTIRNQLQEMRTT